MSVTVDLRHPTFKTFGGDTAFPRPADAKRSAALVLLPLRLFLVVGWSRAAVEKIISLGWWRGDTLTAFAAEQQEHALDPYLPLLDVFGGTLAIPVSFIVVVAQLAIAAGLTTGRWLRPALLAGIGLNINFVMAGAVDPSAFYLVMQVTLLIAAASAQSIASLVRPAFSSTRTFVWRAWVSALLPAVVATPLLLLARTIAPAEVIDDPALMLVFLGYLTSGALLLRLHTTSPDQTTRSLPRFSR